MNLVVQDILDKTNMGPQVDNITDIENGEEEIVGVWDIANKVGFILHIIIVFSLVLFHGLLSLFHSYEDLW